jgi:hypothetical protein
VYNANMFSQSNRLISVCMYVCYGCCVASRVKACVSELVSLDLDVRSSAAYGLAHILAALTVTNSELMAKALADKVL